MRARRAPSLKTSPMGVLEVPGQAADEEEVHFLLVSQAEKFKNWHRTNVIRSADLLGLWSEALHVVASV